MKVVNNEPKETAVQLINAFAKHVNDEDFGQLERARKCAAICAETMLKTIGGIWADVAAVEARSCAVTLNHQQFWTEVKEQIEIV